MIIVPIQTSPEIVLELQFSKDEKEHPLFTTISSDINQSKSVTVSNTKTESMEIAEEDKPLEYYTKTITAPVNPKEDITTQLGKLVDEIREKYCGDVKPPEIKSIDTKTKEPIYNEKDYTGIPKFTIGKIEPVKEVTKTIEPIKKN